MDGFYTNNHYSTRKRSVHIIFYINLLYSLTMESNLNSVEVADSGKFKYWAMIVVMFVVLIVVNIWLGINIVIILADIIFLVIFLPLMCYLYKLYNTVSKFIISDTGIGIMDIFSFTIIVLLIFVLLTNLIILYLVAKINSRLGESEIRLGYSSQSMREALSGLTAAVEKLEAATEAQTNFLQFLHGRGAKVD